MRRVGRYLIAIYVIYQGQKFSVNKSYLALSNMRVTKLDKQNFAKAFDSY